MDLTSIFGDVDNSKITSYNAKIHHKTRAQYFFNYCMAMQFDGFVLNGDVFISIFLKCDFTKLVWP